MESESNCQKQDSGRYEYYGRHRFHGPTPFGGRGVGIGDILAGPGGKEPRGGFITARGRIAGREVGRPSTAPRLTAKVSHVGAGGKVSPEAVVTARSGPLTGTESLRPRDSMTGQRRVSVWREGGRWHWAQIYAARLPGTGHGFVPRGGPRWGRAWRGSRANLWGEAFPSPPPTNRFPPGRGGRSKAGLSPAFPQRRQTGRSSGWVLPALTLITLKRNQYSTGGFSQHIANGQPTRLWARLREMQEKSESGYIVEYAGKP